MLAGVRILGGDFFFDSSLYSFPDPLVLGPRTKLPGLCNICSLDASPYDVNHDDYVICFPSRCNAGGAPALSASAFISIMAHASATGRVNLYGK